MFIRFASSEDRSVNFENLVSETQGCNTEGYVRGVSPVVAKSRIWNIQTRWAMHKGNRAKCWLSGIAKIYKRIEVFCK